MANWADVRRIALALPEVTEQLSGHSGVPGWRVKGKLFVWDRPLHKTDLKALEALGEPIPDGPLLAARVAHLEAKEALLAADDDVIFSIPHFDGYLAVLARLDQIAVDDLEEYIVEAWLCQAPKRLAKEYLESVK
jgi:hypothetical protein